MSPPDPDTIARAAGAAPTGTRRVPGGDVCEALRLDLTDGRAVFVKYRAGGPPGMFAAEAAGLEWLSRAHALRVPHVIAHDAEWLALEWIDEAPRDPHHDEALGRGLAALHMSGAPAFGAPYQGFIGPLCVHNDSRPDWPTFLAECRLIPLADAAGLPLDTRLRLDSLLPRLPDLLGPPEPPALLHGDLWRGNCMTGPAGEPVLVDPAALGGHREVDLAMMRLFGGFSDRVFAAYDEVFPLAPGHAQRVDVNQLIPLLVHAALLGGTYGASVDRILRSLA